MAALYVVGRRVDQQAVLEIEVDLRRVALRGVGGLVLRGGHASGSQDSHFNRIERRVWPAA